MKQYIVVEEAATERKIAIRAKTEAEAMRKYESGDYYYVSERELVSAWKFKSIKEWGRNEK